MRPRSVTALGASISVGLGVFVLLGQFSQVAGQQDLAAPYILLAIMAVPLILTYAERLGVTPGSGGAYNLARTSGLVWLTYGAGWFILGGYLCLIALLGWGAALHLDLIAGYFFGQQLDLIWLTVIVIGLATLLSILGTSGNWKSRSTYVYLTLIVLLIVTLRDLFYPGSPEAPTSRVYNTNAILSVTALMMSGLWGLQFILSIRDEIHRPTRTLPQALTSTVVLGAGLGALAGMAISLSGFSTSSLTPLVEILGDTGLLPKDLIVILYAAAGVLISSIALNQAFVHGLRQVGDMTRDGFLPERLQVISEKYNAAVVGLFLLASLSIVLAGLVPILTLVGLAALLFLWLTALVHLPEAFSTKPRLPEKRFPKLPFHPLFPWLTIATGIYLPFNLDLPVWILAGGWLLLGMLYYLVHARQGGLTVRRRDVVVGETGPLPTTTIVKNVVMVAIANPKTAPTLLQVGARLARARHGSLVALNVLPLAEQIPNNLKRQAAQQAWDSLSELVGQTDLGDVAVRSVVRLAPTPTTGILETVDEEGVSLLVLGWESEHPPEDRPVDSILDPVIKRAPCDVAIVRGAIPQVVKQALVPTAGGPFAPVALTLSHGLIDQQDGLIWVENLVEEPLSAEREAQAQADLQTTVKVLQNGTAVEQRVVQVDDIKGGILAEARTADLLLIGASKKGFPERAFFGGLPVEIGDASSTPTIVARGRDTASQLWLRQLLGALSDSLPTLTAARQTEVYQNMREAAQPNVDFFVLITLSATIASLGLLQNSAAVIIGAMLVAPLMSPILGMAMSIVRADLRLLPVAAEATAKGSVLAILVGVAVVIISPIETATSEILARTQPNVLDLGVALASGAAAGYAISRKEVAAALPGVAIAAALVPPLCVVGYGLGTSQLTIASGSLLLFITNLIAIIFAAALTFLALGFHPKRTEQGEFRRGLQVTVISLLVIFCVLFLTTAVSILQINQENAVEEIFNNEVVARAGRVSEMQVLRSPGGIIITATIIDLAGSNLTPAEIEEIDKQLEETFFRPVTVDAIIVPGTVTQLEGAASLRQLENLFSEAIRETGADVITLNVSKTAETFNVFTAIVVSEAEQLTQADLSAIQAELTSAMKAPVAIEATILPGVEIDLEPSTPARPTPTAEP
jgi:uncharacterized hydrophobic protein (TIGR00271 family)